LAVVPSRPSTETKRVMVGRASVGACRGLHRSAPPEHLRGDGRGEGGGRRAGGLHAAAVGSAGCDGCRAMSNTYTWLDTVLVATMLQPCPRSSRSYGSNTPLANPSPLDVAKCSRGLNLIEFLFTHEYQIMEGFRGKLKGLAGWLRAGYGASPPRRSGLGCGLG